MKAAVKQSILIIDDDQGDVKLLSRALASEKNLSIHSVHSLKAGLDLIQDTTVDIVLLDLSLPDSRGLETVKHFVNTHPEIPVVVITGLDSEEVGIAAITQGAQDYLIKNSYDSEGLAHCIRYAIERHRSASQLKLVLDVAREAFVSINDKGIIIDWNPAAERTFGWSKMEAVGKELATTIISPAHREAHFKRLQSYLDTGETKVLQKRIELLAFHREGKEFPIEATINPLKTGDVVTFHAFIRDISERKQLERLKDEFISTASHELRSPMAILQVAVANLEDEMLSQLSSQQMEVLKIVRNNIKRMGIIVNDLLDISRLESGSIEPKCESIEPFTLLRDVTNNLLVLTKVKQISLTNNVESGLPPISADADMLTQVLNNLTSNALRYAKQSIVINACCLNDEGKQVIKFSVSNDGPSISVEDQEKLFQKFSQVNRIKGGAGYKGTGLGLAICKKIIELHWGRIWIESVDGGLTTFNFTIPLA